MTLQFSLTQGDNRYCVVGYVSGNESHPETVGWTSDGDMALKILDAITQRWTRYGAGMIVDFDRRGGRI